jgi:hypothetical protein
MEGLILYYNLIKINQREVIFLPAYRSHLQSFLIPVSTVTWKQLKQMKQVKIEDYPSEAIRGQ